MSEIIKVLPPEPLKALLALAMFRFLTPQQSVRLGIASSDTVMRDYVFARLEKRPRPLAKSKKVGTWLPKVHYLTKHGAEELADMYKLPIDQFPYPKGQVQFGETFARHRFAQIDFHIGMRQWALSRGDTDFTFAHMDFDVSGSYQTGNLKKPSQIDLPDNPTPIIADGIFKIEVNDTPLIYVLEVHRTTETKRVAFQIQRYIDALECGAISFKYSVQTSPFICSVHTKDHVLRGVKKHLLNLPEFQAFKSAFLFNTTEQLANDFSEGWHFADNTPAQPFPKGENTEKLELFG